MQAACYGHLASVQLLLQSRAKVNVANSWGATALVGAAQGGFLTVVQVASVFVCGCVSLYVFMFFITVNSCLQTVLYNLQICYGVQTNCKLRDEVL